MRQWPEHHASHRMCFNVSIHPHLPGSHVFNCPLCVLLWPFPTALCFSPTSLKKMEQEWTHHMDHAEWWRSPSWIQLQRWPLSASFSLSALLLGGETMRVGLSCRQKSVSVGLRAGAGSDGMGWEGGSTCTLASPYECWDDSHLNPKPRIASLPLFCYLFILLFYSIA